MKQEDRSDFISWFAGNHVAANLLMLFILVAGTLSLFDLKKEVFPDFDLGMISVSVEYPGASPSEVEEGICVRIEEQIAGIEGLRSIQSRAVEGSGTVIVELERGTDMKKALDEVKAEVDRIVTFPEDAEEPVVVELSGAKQVINLVLYGDVPERTLKVLAEKVRADLTLREDISLVQIAGARDYQISVEVPEETLRRYGLTFTRVTEAVRNSSLDLPGGTIRTDAGEILVRTRGQRYTGPEFEDIVVLTRPDGSVVRLREIGKVIDGFDEESEILTRFDGMPAVMVQVFRVADQSALDVARAVHRYVDENRTAFPSGVQVDTWRDDSKILKSRMDLLIRNGRLGLLLVFACLTLFLDLRLAFWVTMGIPISFFGTFWLLPQLGVSINMISLFAFIICLGIVVDDAIVVGENIFSHWESGKPPLQAAIDGAREMLVPVTFAILTTVAAFAPLLFVEGGMGQIMRVVPIVVISVLGVSLLEAVTILPAHLSGLKKRHHRFRRIDRPSLAERYRRRFAHGLQHVVEGPYDWLLHRAVNWRYLTLACALTLLLAAVGVIQGGHIKFTFLPKVESDNVVARLSMPRGTSLAETKAVVQRLEDAARRLRESVNGEVAASGASPIEHVFSMVGTQSESRHGVAPSAGSHVGEVNIQLLDSEFRTLPSAEVAARWRELTGEIPDVESLTFTSSLFSAGNPIEVRISGDHFDTLKEVAGKVKHELAAYPGVSDISDTFRDGKLEMKLSLKPAARTLGLTLADLAKQVRQGYFGDEALRVQRGRDDMKVMVRYPESERRSLGDIENMRIRTTSGAEVPFSYVAEVDLGRGYAAITREERRRVVSVTADVDESVTTADEVLASIRTRGISKLEQDYPDLGFSFEGEQKSQRESMESLRRGFLIALIGIYALLAVPFRSYAQPVIVMLAIPFGIVGAILGHIMLGLSLSMLSMFGIVALSGIVVNDSLIMIDFINRARQKGEPLKDAIINSGKMRFRPIILTSFTTFFGLLPMILERSMQARFLIPMAVSLAFGVMVATGITLLMVPSAYMVLEDLLGVFRLSRAEPRAQGETRS